MSSKEFKDTKASWTGFPSYLRAFELLWWEILPQPVLQAHLAGSGAHACPLLAWGDLKSKTWNQKGPHSGSPESHFHYHKTLSFQGGPYAPAEIREGDQWKEITVLFPLWQLGPWRLKPGFVLHASLRQLRANYIQMQRPTDVCVSF